jgi:hypothetical protein
VAIEPLKFEFVAANGPLRDSLLSLASRRIGPDGVELEYNLKFVKPGRGTAFVVVQLELRVATKVRSAVVAQWLLAQLGPRCESLMRKGLDYRGDPAGLALLLDAWTERFPDGTPSDPPPDPPKDDADGGAAVGARLKRGPPGLPGRARPIDPDPGPSRPV